MVIDNLSDRRRSDKLQIRNNSVKVDTNVGTSDVIREQREVLRKKLQMLVSGKIHETRSSRIDFRTWPDLKYVYSLAPERVKASARKAFESIVLAWFLNEDIVVHADGDKPAIFNINIAISESTSSSNVNVNILIEIKELVEKLYRLKDPLPPIQRGLVETLYKKVSKLN